MSSGDCFELFRFRPDQTFSWIKTSNDWKRCLACCLLFALILWSSRYLDWYSPILLKVNFFQSEASQAFGKNLHRIDIICEWTNRLISRIFRRGWTIFNNRIHLDGHGLDDSNLHCFSTDFKGRCARTLQLDDPKLLYDIIGSYFASIHTNCISLFRLGLRYDVHFKRIRTLDYQLTHRRSTGFIE